MISYVKGPITAVEGDTIVVEAGCVGLAIHVPLSVLDQLPGVGQQATIYTYFQVKEDALSLYGFLSRQDRDMFRQLIGVSGIGPKAALGLLSALRPDDLRLAIITGDAKAISRAPGIGAKTEEPARAQKKRYRRWWPWAIRFRKLREQSERWKSRRR